MYEHGPSMRLVVGAHLPPEGDDGARPVRYTVVRPRDEVELFHRPLLVTLKGEEIHVLSKQLQLFPPLISDPSRMRCR